MFGKQFKPSDLAIESSRMVGQEGNYQPSSFMRFRLGVLEQMWWHSSGVAVWEPIPTGDLSLREIALGKYKKAA